MNKEFFKAIKKGNLEQIKHLLEDSAFDINKPNWLLAAMQGKNLAIINYLLDKNVAINGFQSAKPIHYLAATVAQNKTQEEACNALLERFLTHENLEASPLERQIVTLIKREQNLNDLQGEPSELCLALFQFELAEEAIAFLLRNQDKIDLSFHNNSHVNIAFYLCSQAQHLLIADKALRDNLTIAILEASPAQGLFQGINAVWNLCSSVAGRALLAQDPALRAKLTSKSLEASPAQGAFQGINTAWMLCASAEGLALLIIDDALRFKLTSKSLETAPTQGPLRGTNVAYLICSRSVGLTLLAKDDTLRAKLTSKSLEAGPAEGPDQGKTVAWLLCNSPEGLALLAKDDALRAKLTSQSLEASPAEGPDQGKTVAWLLCNSPEGLALLAKDDALRAKLTSQSLEASPAEGPDQGKTVAWLICNSPQGRALLAKDSALRAKLTSKSLEARPAQGENQNRNAAWCLFNSDLNLLQTYPDLIAKISTQALTAPVFDGQTIRTTNMVGQIKAHKLTAVYADLLLRNLFNNAEIDEILTTYQAQMQPANFPLARGVLPKADIYLFSQYKCLPAYFKDYNFSMIHKLVKNEPRLLKVLTNNKNNLLHEVVIVLNELPESASLTSFYLHSKLFKQLKSLQSGVNASGLRPCDLSIHNSIKKALRLISPFQEVLEEILFANPSTLVLLKNLLERRYCLTATQIINFPLTSYDTLGIRQIKTIDSLDALRNQILEHINGLISFTDFDIDLLDFETRLKLSKLSEVADQASNLRQNNSYENLKPLLRLTEDDLLEMQHLAHYFSELNAKVLQSKLSDTTLTDTIAANKRQALDNLEEEQPAKKAMLHVEKNSSQSNDNASTGTVKTREHNFFQPIQTSNDKENNNNFLNIT